MKLLPSFVLFLNSSFQSFKKKKRPKSSWQHLNFSVMFTTENEIIRRSWRQIYRLFKFPTTSSYSKDRTLFLAVKKRGVFKNILTGNDSDSLESTQNAESSKCCQIAKVYSHCDVPVDIKKFLLVNRGGRYWSLW